MHQLLSTDWHYLVGLLDKPSTWYTIGLFLAGGLGSHFTIQLLKYWKDLQGRQHLLRNLNGLFAFVLAALQALATNGASLGTLVGHAATIAAISSVAYRVLNSTLYRKFEDLEAKASAYDATQAPAPAVSAVPQEFSL